jgi:hypothetical protein
MSERVGVARWQMRALLLFALAFANLNDIWSPDVLPNALFAWTVVQEGDLDYDEFVFRPAERKPPQDPLDRSGAPTNKLDSEAYFFRACGESTATEPPGTARSPGGPPAPGPNDRVCSIFPPGIAFLAFPFFLPFVLAGADPLNLGLLVRVGHVAGAAIEVIAVLFLWSLMRRFASERWSLCARAALLLRNERAHDRVAGAVAARGRAPRRRDRAVAGVPHAPGRAVA